MAFYEKLIRNLNSKEYYKYGGITMTVEAVKEFVKSYSELKARKDVIDKIQQYSHNKDNNLDKEYSLLSIKIQIIESALKILSEDEKQIVFLHLLDNVKWSEVKSLYEQQVGMELNYSERTFFRIQKNALKKIETFIINSHFEQYID